LDDDILSSLQHFGDELRATRRTRPASLITTVRPWAARAAFETRTTAGTSAAIGATAAAVGASTAAIGASATAIAATVASTATEGPLKARARIAADTSGVPREIFARSRWTANARRASFARQEDHVIFVGRHSFRDGFTRGRSDQFLVGVLCLEVFVVDMFVLMLTVSGMMFGMFLGHVRGEFRPVGSAAGFDFRGFFFGEFRNLGNCCSLGFSHVFFCLFFCFFFVEFGTADDGIDFRCFRSLLLLRFDEAGS
jgi:hypothetical protein